MAKFEITSPAGERFEIEAPEGATDAEVQAFVAQQLQTQAPAPPTPGEGGRVVNLPIDQQEIPIPTMGSYNGEAPQPVSAAQEAAKAVSPTGPLSPMNAVSAGGQAATELAKAAVAAPAETAGQGFGTLAGARLGASIPGPVALKFAGAVGGGAAGGIYAAMQGMDVDELLGKITDGFLGEKDEKTGGDKLQRAVENQIIVSVFGVGSKLGEKMINANTRGEFVEKTVKFLESKLGELPGPIKDLATKAASRAKNSVDIVDGTFNNPITGEQYIRNAREAARNVSGGMELPVPFETGGKQMSKQAMDVAAGSPQNPLTDYLDLFAAKARQNADKVIAGNYRPEVASDSVKSTVDAFNRMLREPIAKADKKLMQFHNVKITDSVMKAEIKAALSPETSAVMQKLSSDEFDMLTKAVDTLPQNATVGDLRRFSADLESIGGKLNIKDTTTLDRAIGDVKSAVEASLAKKQAALTDVGEYAKKAEAIAALKDYNTAALGYRRAMGSNRLAKQLGATENAQRSMNIADDQTINKVFESYDNYRNFKQMATALGEGGQAALETVENAFRYKIRTALTEDKDGFIMGADKILRKGGGLSAVPQDRLIAEAAGPEVLKYLQDLSVVSTALRKGGVGAETGLNPALRAGTGLGLSTAFSTEDAARLITRLDQKLAAGASNKLLNAMTDPKMKDKFYALANTPLVSPRAYDTYVSMAAALSVPVNVSREEFDQNAEAVQKMVDRSLGRE